ncbi:uncharacterized protein AMSG_11543 [Thecamonas trahens ATCC 50062]|uniref:VCBS repeat-containing protein n=1 Tax=Thecamonas trahens ATCC 50062 TaxID=461836 RepID=A0A0L0D588_THETB|nr:hypothetical protein AMSG_11543 [Thecamonas trahens ATCC 50062]KNC46473.1 hypothetical protein AMSG_11543 [Thecamonas trahens ATCC 50062]|eukprot:XP_013752601.1 hypothetical protein AMSG_11543 [Thecamonas trahens ATCC 50062]
MTAFPISKLLSSMGAADIDGDGLDDVVLAWFRNNGASFSQMPSFTTRAVESRFIAADFDNDTDVDIEYVYRQSSSEARLVRAVNDGTGNFDVHEYVLPNRGSWSFVSVDINGDDVRDVIVALDSTMELIVSPSNVSDWITTPRQQVGTTTKAPFVTPTGSIVAAGDVDGDGDGDVVYLASDGSVVLVEALTINSYAGPRHVDAGLSGAGAVVGLELVDVNRDGSADIVAACADAVVLAASDGLAWNISTLANVSDTSASIAALCAVPDGSGVAAVTSNGTVIWIPGNGSSGIALPDSSIRLFGARGAVCGNVDGAGAPDVLVWNDEAVVVWYAEAAGTWSSAVVDVPLSNLVGVAVGDVDGDGTNDIGVVSSSGGGWMRGDGARGFGPLLQVSVPLGVPVDVAITPARGLVVSASSSSTKSNTYAFRGGAVAEVEQVADNGGKLTVVDMDGDGDDDLFVATSSTVTWFETADALPMSGVGFARGTNVYHELVLDVVLADLDLDGDTDAVIRTPDVVGWLPNLNGEVSFGALTPVSTTTASYVAVADMDDDGDLDVVVAAAALAWHANQDGRGRFGSGRAISSPLTTLTGIRKILIVDANRDGSPDVLTSSDSLTALFLYTGTGIASELAVTGTGSSKVYVGGV